MVLGPHPKLLPFDVSILFLDIVPNPLGEHSPSWSRHGLAPPLVPDQAMALMQGHSKCQKDLTPAAGLIKCLRHVRCDGSTC